MTDNDVQGLFSAFQAKKFNGLIGNLKLLELTRADKCRLKPKQITEKLKKLIQDY